MDGGRVDGAELEFELLSPCSPGGDGRLMGDGRRLNCGLPVLGEGRRGSDGILGIITEIVR